MDSLTPRAAEKIFDLVMAGEEYGFSYALLSSGYGADQDDEKLQQLFAKLFETRREIILHLTSLGKNEELLKVADNGGTSNYDIENRDVFMGLYEDIIWA